MSLKVVSLSKRYGDKWALRDVSFDVADGEVFGIFGASGAGKSTVLKTLRGETQSNGGTIFVSGQDVSTSRDRKRLITHSAPSSTSLWDRLRNKPSITSRTDVMILIEEAFATSGSVVLFDEDTFCGRDKRETAEGISLIRRLAREKNCSVIFATSDFEKILDACDRALVLVKGQVLQIGTPQELYEKPEHAVVAAQIGDNNLIRARRLTSSKAEIPEFHTIDGGHRLFAQRIERGSLGALNQNITLAIRPEHISISFGASFPEDNLLRATVTGVKFRGPTTLVSLNADGLDLLALVPRLIGLTTSEECVVSLPPDRIQIFKD